MGGGGGGQFGGPVIILGGGGGLANGGLKGDPCERLRVAWALLKLLQEVAFEGVFGGDVDLRCLPPIDS